MPKQFITFGIIIIVIIIVIIMFSNRTQGDEPVEQCEYSEGFTFKEALLSSSANGCGILIYGGQKIHLNESTTPEPTFIPNKPTYTPIPEECQYDKKEDLLAVHTDAREKNICEFIWWGSVKINVPDFTPNPLLEVQQICKDEICEDINKYHTCIPDSGITTCYPHTPMPEPVQTPIFFSGEKEGKVTTKITIVTTFEKPVPVPLTIVKPTPIPTVIITPTLEEDTLWGYYYGENSSNWWETKHLCEINKNNENYVCIPQQF